MKHIYFLLFSLISAIGFAQLTPPDELQSYYSSVDFNQTGIDLKEDLINVTTDKHEILLTYANMWTVSQITDEDPDNSDNVLLIYGFNDGGNVTEHRSRGKTNYGGNNGNWNREHTYPKSLGTPNLGTSGPGSDAHLVRPCDVQRNSQRGNDKFINGSGNSKTIGSGFYPGDEWKGDVARIMMYMYLRYGERCLPTNVGFGSDANTPDAMIDLFLQWNAEDPVSDFERTRNTYHGDLSNPYSQGNRNPFIDNPYLATLIWGGETAENSWESLSITDQTIADVKIFPNPASEDYITIASNLDILAEVYDIFGKKVSAQQLSDQQKKVNISSLSKGVYMLKLSSDTGSVTKKLIRN